MAESPGSARLRVFMFSCRVLTLGRLSPSLDQHEATTAADNVDSSKVIRRQKAAENVHTETSKRSCMSCSKRILRQSLQDSQNIQINSAFWVFTFSLSIWQHHYCFNFDRHVTVCWLDDASIQEDTGISSDLKWFPQRKWNYFSAFGTLHLAPSGSSERSNSIPTRNHWVISPPNPSQIQSVK